MATNQSSDMKTAPSVMASAQAGRPLSSSGVGNAVCIQGIGENIFKLCVHIIICAKLARVLTHSSTLLRFLLWVSAAIRRQLHVRWRRLAANSVQAVQRSELCAARCLHSCVARAGRRADRPGIARYWQLRRNNKLTNKCYTDKQVLQCSIP